MIKIALIYIDEYIKEFKLEDKVKPFLQIHDALYCYVSDDFINEWKEIQETMMIRAGKIFIKDIPVIIDTKITKYLSK